MSVAGSRIRVGIHRRPVQCWKIKSINAKAAKNSNGKNAKELPSSLRSATSAVHSKSREFEPQRRRYRRDGSLRSCRCLFFAAFALMLLIFRPLYA